MPKSKKTKVTPGNSRPAAKMSAVTGLSAADCARRTGLTVRALRVYERAGLLKPARSAKGWRLYGPDELIRLNTIVALKGFGLSLREVRKAFGSSPPALVQVLDLQLRNWSARRMAADRTIALIQSATARLKSRANLSINELCELMRSTEVSNMQAIVRELINQHITPEQEREWLTYWAKRHPKEVFESEETTAYRAIMQDFHALMKRGATPDSEAVQEVMDRSFALWLKSNLRQRQLEQLEWNPEVTRAWFILGGKLMARTASPDSAEDAARLEKFIHDARMASRSTKLLIPVVTEAMRLRGLDKQPADPEARSLAARYAKICQDEGVGDPVLHARWIAAFGQHEASKPGWEYLAQISAH
ncbi:MAG TPA: MerR family transcriptional regulator [Steroidobacteraceae bacterium]|nr:MerR family transcriptional regulator [Steroidobacteraceae bacterium]